MQSMEAHCSQTTWVQPLTPLLTSNVILGNLPNLQPLVSPSENKLK